MSLIKGVFLGLMGLTALGASLFTPVIPDKKYYREVIPDGGCYLVSHGDTDEFNDDEKVYTLPSKTTLFEKLTRDNGAPAYNFDTNDPVYKTLFEPAQSFNSLNTYTFDPRVVRINRAAMGSVVGSKYVLTNYHVVLGGENHSVQVGRGETEQSINAQVVAKDRNTDLALLRLPYALPFTDKVKIRKGNIDGETVHIQSHLDSTTVEAEYDRMTHTFYVEERPISKEEYDSRSYENGFKIWYGDSGSRIIDSEGSMSGVLNGAIHSRGSWKNGAAKGYYAEEQATGAEADKTHNFLKDYCESTHQKTKESE